MTAQEIESSAPLDLRGIAQTIVNECGDRGAIVITAGRTGIRIVGAGDLTAEEFREALYEAIQYSHTLEDQQTW